MYLKLGYVVAVVPLVKELSKQYVYSDNIKVEPFS